MQSVNVSHVKIGGRKGKLSLWYQHLRGPGKKNKNKVSGVYNSQTAYSICVSCNSLPDSKSLKSKRCSEDVDDDSEED